MIFEKTDIIKFGDYKNKTIEEIILGLNFEPDKTSINVKNYLQQLFFFLTNYITEYNFVLPDFFFFKEIINDVHYRPVKRIFSKPNTLLQNIVYITDEVILIDRMLDFDTKIKTKNLIKQIISSTFNYGTLFIGTYDNEINKPLKKDILNCFANISFINWCIKKRETFVLSMDAINSSYLTKSLISFEVLNDKNFYELVLPESIRLSGIYNNDEIIFYKPIFSIKEKKFDKKIIDLNAKKLNKLKT